MCARATSPKVAIVGAGSVGATLAYTCLIRGAGKTVALYDLNADKTRAEVLDLNHGLQFVPSATVIGSDDIEVCAGADLVVITAGAKQKPGQTRLDLAEANGSMCRALLPKLLEVAPDAVVLMVTNPVDVLTYTALQISGLPANRVLGTGTVLDSSRLRVLVARRAGVAVRSVHAYIAGEHGDAETPLWSSATIGAVPLLDWPGTAGNSFGVDTRREIMDHVMNAAEQIIRGKGATNYAVALAGARVIEAILQDEHAVLPVTSMMSPEMAERTGISDVCLSIPSIVARSGVVSMLPTPLSQEETAGLRNSAAAVRETIRTVGLAG